MNKNSTRKNNIVSGLPGQYSNSLKFLDQMYDEPIYINSVKKSSTVTATARKKTVQQKKDKYNLNKLKTIINPFTFKIIALYCIFGIVASIVLGFVLIAIFAGKQDFNIFAIIKEVFSFNTSSFVQKFFSAILN
ncbi:MAG: hypothetical protein LBU60_06295 [Clostridiales bacterium]|jgi:hypothetical protein|nr:hypothetical protein [Clostridiales bacterium]